MAWDWDKLTEIMNKRMDDKHKHEMEILNNVKSSNYSLHLLMLIGIANTTFKFVVYILALLYVIKLIGG